MLGTFIAQLVAGAFAACPDRPADLLAQSASQVVESYDLADMNLLLGAAARLEHAVRCLDEAPPAALVARLHQAQALVAWANGDEVGAVRSWAAARAADPTLRPDPLRWPSGHPMHRVWSQALRVSDDRVSLSRRPAGGWIVDGISGAVDVPAARSFLIQGRAMAGDVLYSEYCEHIAELDLLDFDELDPDARTLRKRRIRIAGSVVSIGLGLGAVVSAATAEARRRAILTAPYADLPQLGTSASRASTTAGILGAAALGTATVTWTVRW